ncbi:MAG: hypothetical protein U0797_16480 [Gemmataceae bacterium]
MSVLNPRVPAVISMGLICLALGGAAGVAVTQLYGPFFLEPKEVPPSDPGMISMAPPPGAIAAMEGRGGMMGKGGRNTMAKGFGGKGGPPARPPARAQLAQLVTKLDQLTEKPLTINLTAEQRAKLAEQLAGLGEEKELSNEEAEKRMKEILEVVKSDKATLEAAGFAWPGPAPAAGGPGAAGGFGNPESAQRLKSLQERLVKGKG